MAEHPAGRPGYRTTEFWLTFAASMLGLIFASGMLESLPDDNIWIRVAGLAASMLTAIGYTVSRSLVKRIS